MRRLARLGRRNPRCISTEIYVMLQRLAIVIAENGLQIGITRKVLKRVHVRMRALPRRYSVPEPVIGRSGLRCEACCAEIGVVVNVITPVKHIGTR